MAKATLETTFILIWSFGEILPEATLPPIKLTIRTSPTFFYSYSFFWKDERIKDLVKRNYRNVQPTMPWHRQYVYTSERLKYRLGSPL